MKKFVTLACALMAVAVVKAQDVETVPFTATQVNVPARVRFVLGNEYSFSVESNNTEMARQLQCSVQDGVLNFRLGKSVKPGDVIFDEENGIYFYGVEASALSLTDSESDGNELVITVTAPGMPEFKTSRDYQAIPVKSDKTAVNENLALNGLGDK